MYGHVIAGGWGNTAPYIRTLRAVLTKYRWTNVYIVYDPTWSPKYNAAAKVQFSTLASMGFLPILRPLNSSIPTAYETLLMDFKRSARGSKVK